MTSAKMANNRVIVKKRLLLSALMLFTVYCSYSQSNLYHTDTLRLKIFTASGSEASISVEDAQNINIVLYNEYSCLDCITFPAPDSTKNNIFIAALSENKFKNYGLSHHVNQLYGCKLYFMAEDCVAVAGISLFCFKQDIGPFFMKTQLLLTD